MSFGKIQGPSSSSVGYSSNEGSFLGGNNEAENLYEKRFGNCDLPDNLFTSIEALFSNKFVMDAVSDYLNTCLLSQGFQVEIQPLDDTLIKITNKEGFFPFLFSFGKKTKDSSFNRAVRNLTQEIGCLLNANIKIGPWKYSSENLGTAIIEFDPVHKNIETNGYLIQPLLDNDLSKKLSYHDLLQSPEDLVNIRAMDDFSSKLREQDPSIQFSYKPIEKQFVFRFNNEEQVSIFRKMILSMNDEFNHDKKIGYFRNQLEFDTYVVSFIPSSGNKAYQEYKDDCLGNGPLMKHLIDEYGLALDDELLEIFTAHVNLSK